MSTKKDKFSAQDKNFMKLALNLANARRGLTGNNPSVGCVIVKNNKIISIGQTGYNGRPHAEHNAILNCSENLKDSLNLLAKILDEQKFKNLKVIDMRQKHQVVISE